MSSNSSGKTFRGGVHPEEHKELTSHLAFETMPNPKHVILPLRQHIGKDAKTLVKKGSIVKAGEKIAEPDGFISAPVHSPVAGKVVKLNKEKSVSGFPQDAIVIEAAEENEFEFMPELDPDNVTPDEIRDRVREAGLVGQGGAAFPTFVKLMPPKDKELDYVILNGCECEPYLTRDDRYMIDTPDEVVAGLKLIMKALGVKKGVVGIENNKPKSIASMSEAVKNEAGVSVVVAKTKYPQGAEKMLIKAVTGREVPPGKLPLDVGCVIQNIGTAIAIYRAVAKGEPILTAAMTVSGHGINNPKNLIVPIGTPLSDILDYCGGIKENTKKVVVGGPMMGIAQFDFDAPVMKATSGLLALTEEEINDKEETPCLRCGKCVEVCPLNLLPTKLARYSQLSRWEDAENIGVTVCMECGTCTFTCPANIPLVQWIRLGKKKVITMQRERQQS